MILSYDINITKLLDNSEYVSSHNENQYLHVVENVSMFGIECIKNWN